MFCVACFARIFYGVDMGVSSESTSFFYGEISGNSWMLTEENVKLPLGALIFATYSRMFYLSFQIGYSRLSLLMHA